MLHIMLFVVALLAIVSIVVLSLLVLLPAFLGLPGPMALLCYFASYYARRGGPPTDGYACGIFYIPFNGTPYNNNWHRGAALL